MGLRWKVSGTLIQKEDYIEKIRTRIPVKSKVFCIKVPRGGVVAAFNDMNVLGNIRSIIRIVATKGVRAHFRNRQITPGWCVNKKNIENIIGFSASNGGTVYVYFEPGALTMD